MSAFESVEAPSHSSLRLLAISNGHGEDEVSVRVLRQLRQSSGWDLQAMPIVGEGQAYRQSQFKIFGPTQSPMPSGGFVYLSQKAFWGDITSGLLPLTWSQIQACRRWGSQGGYILAVGDIVPMLFAQMSGAPFVFIGTAKSEYYLRSTLEASIAGKRPWSRWLDSVYLPWERWMMGRSQCKGVFPRDPLTATVLKQWPIPVFDLGNPMLDDLMPQGLLTPERFSDKVPKILLLPGSRPPEVYKNWQRIVEAITPLAQAGECWQFIAAIYRQLDLKQLCEIAALSGWQTDPLLQMDSPACGMKLSNARILLAQNVFNDALHIADAGIAMAGTATEQLVGLGKPVVTLPGEGPQFTWAFAEAQSRLLGPSVHLVMQPEFVPETLKSLLQSLPNRLYADNGNLRMGVPGASIRISAQIQRLFRA